MSQNGNLNGENDGKPLDLRCSFTENPSFVSGSQWGKRICQRDGRHEIGRAGDARGGEWWPRRLPGAVRCWRWGLHQRCSLGEVSKNAEILTFFTSFSKVHHWNDWRTLLHALYLYKCMQTRAHTHIFICIYVYIYIIIYMCIYIYICVCMYVYI